MFGIVDYDVGYVRDMSEVYDRVFFPPKGIAYPRNLRNRDMVDNCDILITCYNTELLITEPKNSVVLAVEYAKQKDKRVFNVF